MHIQAEPRTLPRVAVLLATHMGRTYLDEQIDSILDQAGADLHIFVSDDGSTDGTLELLAERADADARITILPPETFGAPAPNFFRLLTTIPIAEYDYVGFADQDDVWMPAKLERHIRLLAEGRADGISSNVTAFSEDGTRILIKKDYPQRLVDHLFETPGPGSTFLLTSASRVSSRNSSTTHTPRARGLRPRLAHLRARPLRRPPLGHRRRVDGRLPPARRQRRRRQHRPLTGLEAPQAHLEPVAPRAGAADRRGVHPRRLR